MRSKISIPVALMLTLVACGVLPWRAHPESPPTPTADTAEARSQQCHDLKAQIAWYQKQRRVAPPLTTSPEIAAAAQAKNDNTIDTLRQRYEAAGCEEGG